MAEPEFTRGEGADALPQGEATRLNETTDISGPEDVALPEEEVMDDGAEPAEAADFAPVYQPASEDEEFVTGPTTRPDEAQWAGTGRTNPISARTRRMLPALQRAAADPEASETLRELVAYIVRTA